jgi:hypothetical protein
MRALFKTACATAICAALSPALLAQWPVTTTGSPLATFRDIGSTFKDGLPLTPYGSELLKKRMAGNSKDNPEAHCLPNHRVAAHRSGEAHGTFPAHQLRPHGNRYHGRSEGVHEAMDGQASPGHHVGRRVDRIHLRGEQPLPPQ